MVRKLLPPFLVLAGLALAGCGNYGKVEQGRTVAFDKAKEIVTIIADSNMDHKKPPMFSVLPAQEFAMPTDPAERGADPTPGLRMHLDVEKKIITMYNPQTKTLENLPFEVVADHQNVDLRRQHPLVWDAATKKAIVFPKVDAVNKTIEIYSRRQLRLTTIKLAAEDFAKYKEKDWDAGDDVRIYYKEPGKALRFMNINKTNISSR